MIHTIETYLPDKSKLVQRHITASDITFGEWQLDTNSGLLNSYFTTYYGELSDYDEAVSYCNLVMDKTDTLFNTYFLEPVYTSLPPSDTYYLSYYKTSSGSLSYFEATGLAFDDSVLYNMNVDLEMNGETILVKTDSFYSVLHISYIDYDNGTSYYTYPEYADNLVFYQTTDGKPNIDDIGAGALLEKDVECSTKCVAVLTNAPDYILEGPSPFIDDSKMLSIRIPDTVERIYGDRFNDCTNLTQVDFGNNSNRQITHLYDFIGDNCPACKFIVPDALYNDFVTYDAYWVSLYNDNRVVPYSMYYSDTPNEPLSFTATQDNTNIVFMQFKKESNRPDIVIWYSIDMGQWTKQVINTTSELNVTINSGQTLRIIGDNKHGINYGDLNLGEDFQDICVFGINKPVNCSGDIMSLIGLRTKVIPNPGCFARLFLYANLLSIPNLNAEFLTTGCYTALFAYCSNLTSAVLPARRLADWCYRQMFADCTNLTNLRIEAIDNIDAQNACDGILDNVDTTGIFEHTAGIDWTGHISLPTNWKETDYVYGNELIYKSLNNSNDVNI